MAVIDYLENMDFVTLRKLMLEMVPDDVSKEEGSFIYDAVTPIALFVSEMMNHMKVVIEQSFIGTATGSNLDMIAATLPRIYRRAASSEKIVLSLRPASAETLSYVKNNSSTLVFSNGAGETFKVNTDIGITEAVVMRELDVAVSVRKEASGQGSSYIGEAFQMSPAISGVESCLVDSITARGEEREDDDTFRVRIWTTMTSPFLGTIASYRKKIFSEFPQQTNGFSVHNCLVIPRGSKSGFICVVPAKLSTDNYSTEHCTEGELENLQNYLDKRLDGIGGYGLGVAPIGHVVRVRDFSDFNLKQKIIVTVENGQSYKFDQETLRQDVLLLTKKYLREIIDEEIPSSSTYMSDSTRYISFQIHYYVNSHEFAIREGLKEKYGKSIIRNVVIFNTYRGQSPQQDFTLRCEKSSAILPRIETLELGITEEN